MTIRVVFENPPIPIRTMDYYAVVDGREESGPYGHGRTALEALRNLVDALEEQE